MTYLQPYLQTKAAKDKSFGTLQESRSNIRQFLASISGGISELDNAAIHFNMSMSYY